MIMNETPAKIKYEGQEVSLPEEIAADDSKLKAALVTVWPSISTSTIERTREDGMLVVTCTRKAGTKGSLTLDIIGRLQKAPQNRNPAVQLATKLQAIQQNGQLTPKVLGSFGKRIHKAITQGEKHRAQINQTIRIISNLPGRPSNKVPSGF